MRQRSWPMLALWIWAGIMVAFMLLPTLIIIPFSVNSARYLSFPPEGFSLQWFYAFFNDSSWMRAALQSMKIAVASTAISVVLGTLAAFALVRRKPRHGGALAILILFPMLAPHIVLAIGIFGLFSKFDLTETIFGLVLAHSLVTVPFVYINVAARLQVFDCRLEMAAESLGASPMQAFIKITVPNVAPAIVAGGAFAFVTSWDEFIITLFNSDAETQTLPLRIFSGIQYGVDVTAAAAAVVVIMGLVAGGLVYGLWDSILKKGRR